MIRSFDAFGMAPGFTNRRKDAYTSMFAHIAKIVIGALMLAFFITMVFDPVSS
jgi:hypothetical protein